MRSHADLYRVIYRPTGLGFTYPPFAAFWFAPIAHLPVTFDQIALLGAAWWACSSCWPSACERPVRTLQYRTVAWWSLLLLTPMGLLDPVRETVLLGQVNILIAAAVIADMTLIRPERRGVLVGLACGDQDHPRSS